MNSNYVVINNEDNDLGTLAIEKNVFSEMVKQIILDNKNLNIGHAILQNNKVNVIYSDGQLLLNIDVMVKYGNRAMGVIENVQKKIFETITNKTSVSDVIINICVVGFIF